MPTFHEVWKDGPVLAMTYTGILYREDSKRKAIRALELPAL